MSIERSVHHARLEWNPNNDGIQCLGRWTLRGIDKLPNKLTAFTSKPIQKIMIDGSQIESMDSAGAWILQSLLTQFKDADVTVALKGFNDQHRELLSVIQEHAKSVVIPANRSNNETFFYRTGKDTVHKIKQGLDLLEFIGLTAVTQVDAIMHPRHLKWRSILVAIEEVGFQALPIVALLSFLIGIVLAYQMGVELRIYGADIFIVNVTGHAVLREFAPLMTAIIAAGRTSSAYTAQIGMMKVNEEIDALQTMGLSPVEWLVLPKMIGTLIAIPLLTVWADVFGILGGMFMSKISFDISYADFLTRFNEVVPLSTYMIGLTKAPVFAAIIALTGCFQGFRVDYTARSVGQRTTISVVQAIFFLIVADSLFSIYLNWAGI